MSHEYLLDCLCDLCGIAQEYTDIWGNSHQADARSKHALLSAMGYATDSEEALRQSIRQLEEREWLRLLPAVQVSWQGEPALQVELTVNANDVGNELTWTLYLENGEARTGRLVPKDLPVCGQRKLGGRNLVRYALSLGELPEPGYHTLETCQADAPAPSTHKMLLIVAPEHCYQPVAIADPGRAWGPAIQLYGVRSQHNWGIGDFSDLNAIIDWAAEAGAGLIGLNPLHALYPHNPAHASPYSPSSRLFVNVLYIDVQSVPDMEECIPAQEAVNDPAFQARLRALRAGDLVDYPAEASAKLELLHLLYRHFREHHSHGDDPRRMEFVEFQAEGGEALRLHALFEALQEKFHQEDPSVWGWPVWPLAYQEPASPEVAAFVASHSESIEFYIYLQWQAELQTARAGKRSLAQGLGIGLYQDLAVSVDRGGAEAWANRHLYAVDASIGAPPDDFNLNGQNWGLPPLNPHYLKDAAYAPFIATLRRNMRHSGALRIDHVMGLKRLFWVPQGGTPANGTYVAYPFRDLLGILALESQRNQCLVVGEDLGTVPDEVRDALRPLGVLSYRLLYFSKDAAGNFLPPRDFIPNALVAASTHDLPPLAGFWQGIDLDLRAGLGLFPSEELRHQQVVARAEERARILLALEQEGLLPSGLTAHPVSAPAMTPELALAIHRYLARSPAKVMVIQAEDVLGEAQQTNLPGTTDQHPNWRRKLSLNVEEWAGDLRWSALAAAMREERGRSVRRPSPLPESAKARHHPRIPRATYRLQFNANFTFARATQLVPYLAALGISHCYASPYLKARPGSPHGYDIVDHNALNPEIGSQEEFEHFVAALKQNGMEQILDIVPNHMGVMGSDNSWWLDVLENGPASIYADFFDIDWEPYNDQLWGKLLVPVLGDHYGTVLENGELTLVFNQERGEFDVFYFSHRFPIDPREYPRILEYRRERLKAVLGEQHPELLAFDSLTTAFRNLPERMHLTADQVVERNRDKEIHKRHLADLCMRNPDISLFIDGNVREINHASSESADFELLHRLLESQAYRLAYWRLASDEINYRRFFDINDLAALRMEEPKVFAATHGLVCQLLRDGKVAGLRIDHVDGLYDPAQYLKRLQGCLEHVHPEQTDGGSSTVRRFYTVVEKILARDEQIPAKWPVHGTTGYDYLNLATALLVDTAQSKKMGRLYHSFVGAKSDFSELLYHSKKLVMRVAMASELNVLATRLARIAGSDRQTFDFTIGSIRGALSEIVACFPVYRTYVDGDDISIEDRKYIERAVSLAKARSRAGDVSVFEFILGVLLATQSEGKSAAYRETVRRFAMQFQQFTGPVAAKGVEDTSFYRYNPMVSLNEVGGDPRRIGISVDAFHDANRERSKHWPYGMLATSTHDNKRSEDVRARISVLSEMADEWGKRVASWSRINRIHKKKLEGEAVPSRNDEYLLYQTLLGVWPLQGLNEDNITDFRTRIEHYMLKAVREAKVYTSWINPSVEYEKAVADFIQGVLTLAAGNDFLDEFLPFQHTVAYFGMWNSLTQTVLKLTAPGVPDIYQGNEMWDFSLVDPDNRRPVDYELRQIMLQQMRNIPDEQNARAHYLEQILTTPEDGRIKLFMTWKTLSLRGKFEALFRDGQYTPIAVEGTHADHICAFMRHTGEAAVIVVAPRLLAGLMNGAARLPVGGIWADTALRLPTIPAATAWINQFNGQTIDTKPDARGIRVDLAQVFAQLPYGLLVSHPP